ncbi:MAG TPA: OPT/YSL family transporter, partial [Candidatus Dormibacteraeota bacterium]|nr:OPT/YSL family transporter [Candidatus Dormibacteraeota bacterium]
GSHPLPAPQAMLITALAKGVLGGNLDWSLIGIGGLIGAVVVAIDEVLRATGRGKLPPLAVGLGIYLPTSTTAPVVIGALLGYWYERRLRGEAFADLGKRLGVLLASGLIVGESLFGVLLAGLIVASNRGTPLALVGDAFAGPSQIIGTLAFVATVGGLYAWMHRMARRAHGT